jgi:hypothetical protein
MPSRSPRARTGVFAALAATGTLACSDAGPTQPTEVVSPAPATLALAPERELAFAATLEDARTRLLPGMAGAGDPAPLRRALDDLAAALASRDPRAVVRALGRADASLTALEPTSTPCAWR